MFDQHLTRQQATQLCNEASEYLDTDPRFFFSDEGTFVWHNETVAFRKRLEHIELVVRGEVLRCPL